MNETQDLHELALTLHDAEMQSDLYRPTSFWRAAAQQIAHELQEAGIENFRRLKTPLTYFVPNFGPPTNSFTADQVQFLESFVMETLKLPDKSLKTLRQYVSGRFHAMSDFRVLKASDLIHRRPYLHQFNESDFGNPIEQFEFEGRKYSRSALNYLLGLSLLKQHIDTESIRTVMEVGGGFGTLGEILSASGIPDIRYIDIDIPPVQYVAARYLSHVLGAENVWSYPQTRGKDLVIDKLPPATVLCNWQIEKLTGSVDLFVNFISFQEMEPHVVANYLKHVDRMQAKWVLLRNMKEGKQKKTSTHSGVETPVLSEDYIQMLSNYKLIIRNVHPYGHETVDGFHSELLLLERVSP